MMKVIQVSFSDVAFSTDYSYDDLKRNLMWENNRLKRIYVAMERLLNRALYGGSRDLTQVQIELSSSITRDTGFWATFIGVSKDPHFNATNLREWFEKTQQPSRLEKYLRGKFNRPKAIYEFAVCVDIYHQNLIINFYPQGERSPFGYEFQVG